jgi:hypothetical protein
MKTEHAAESAAARSGTGRIAPLNMASETSGLSYDSLVHDMTTVNDSSDESSLCVSWA